MLTKRHRYAEAAFKFAIIIYVIILTFVLVDNGFIIFLAFARGILAPHLLYRTCILALLSEPLVLVLKMYLQVND